mgnify:FL=1
MTDPAWTPTEDQLLQRVYPSAPMRMLQCLFGFRTRAAITIRASRLHVRRNWKWTREQDRVIECCYARYGASYCQQYLEGKTLHSIHHRARRLNVGYRFEKKKELPEGHDEMAMVELRKKIICGSWN